MSVSEWKITLCDPKRVGPAAMRVITELQHHHPLDQVAGIAMAFVMLVKRHRLHAGTLMQIAENMLNEDPRFYPEVKALRLYIENEIV